MGHSRGSRPGGTTDVRSVGGITATGWHSVHKFLGNRRPGALEAAAGSAFFMDATASASARRAYGRPHERKKDTGQDDEDGLFEGLEGRRGAVLQTVYSLQPLPTGSGCTSRRKLQQATAGGPFTMIRVDLTGPHVR